MAINFPNSPTNGQVFTSGSTSWTYDGTKWNLNTNVAVSNDSLPVGAIMWFGNTTTTPPGWLRADGSSQSRTSYPDLHALIGTTYGDGSTPGSTFALPNMVQAGTGSPVKIIKATLGGIVEPSTVSHASTHTEGGSDVITVTGNQIANYQTYRNIIINGGMAVAQRSTSSVALTTSLAYGSVDRWMAGQGTTAAGTIQQITTNLPSNFVNGIRIGRNNAATSTGNIIFTQSLETRESILLQGKTVTLSFYAKAGTNFSPTSNNISARVYTGTGTDQAGINIGNWTGSANPINITQAITTSWVRYSFTGTISSTATQIGVYFTYTPVGTAGADDNLYITGVQLEAGSVATPFEFEPYETTFRKCLRYFQKYAANEIHVINAYFNVALTSGNTESGPPLFVPMRTTPTMTDSSGNAYTQFAFIDYAASNAQNANLTYVGTDKVMDFNFQRAQNNNGSVSLAIGKVAGRNTGVTNLSAEL